jgi:hypothetical protein
MDTEGLGVMESRYKAYWHRNCLPWLLVMKLSAELEEKDE